MIPIRATVLMVFTVLLVTICSEAKPPAGRELPGFVYVPEGKVHPGSTKADRKSRVQGDPALEAATRYDVWGDPRMLTLPGYWIGRMEVSNAQFKLYLDQEFRVTHTTGGKESLAGISGQFLRFRGKPDRSEWAAIYAMNWQAIVAALAKEGQWPRGGDPTDPVAAVPDLENLALPAGIELTLYRHRIPRHWYGWCRLSGLRVGKEYFDPRKPAAEAFVVPAEGPFEEHKLRASDFAAYPIRDLSAAEFLAFAEWAGCHLPSEYEFERAGRGDAKNEVQHTVEEWDRRKQKRGYGWADNPDVRDGPLPVDGNAHIAKMDSPFGVRHLLGNVWELTRTFFDRHPFLKPKPPPHPQGLFNYALVAKGGSWGDRWQFIQLSARTGTLGPSADLTLQYQNRADSLGIRLVKHPQPGEDLLRHTIRRTCYSPGRGQWDRVPHQFAVRRMAGIEEIHIVEAESPYIHVRAPARGIAAAPTWFTTLEDKRLKDAERDWKRGRADGGEYDIVGILRIDVPFVAGKRLSSQEQKQLEAARKKYEEDMKVWKKTPRRERGPKPVPPDAPDEYEAATEKNREQIGIWRAHEFGPGEYLVLHWYGHVALANKTLVMPPDALVLMDGKTQRFKRSRGAAQKASLVLGEDTVTITLSSEEQGKKSQEPPGVEMAHEWALYDTLPSGWLGRQPGKYSWEVTFTIRTPEGALAKHDWTGDEKEDATETGEED